MRRAALGLRGRRGARSLHVAVVGGGVVGGGGVGSEMGGNNVSCFLFMMPMVP